MLPLFPTLYQMHHTDYRISDSLKLLKTYREECPKKYLAEINEVIEEILELSAMFSSSG